MNPQSLQSISLKCTVLDRPEALLTLPSAFVVGLIKPEIPKSKQSIIGNWENVPIVERLILNLQLELYFTQYCCSTVSNGKRRKAIQSMTKLVLKSLPK